MGSEEKGIKTDESFRDATRSESNNQLSIYLIDSTPDIHAYMLKMSLKKLKREANLFLFDDQEEGLNAIPDSIDGKVIVLCGVVGNGLGIWKGEEPWARYKPSESIQIIQSKGAKAIIFTGGNYSQRQAMLDGADGYINKGEIKDLSLVIDCIIQGIPGYL